MPEAMNALERAIVSQDFSAIPPEILEQVNLAAYAYSKDKASRNAITKRAFLQYTMRHQVIKQAILPLLKAWSDAGIKVMLYKGFYLAEFVYDHPAERFYGDVDVIIRPEQLKQAREVAERAGFTCHQQNVHIHHHEAFTISNSEGSMYLEVHKTSYPLRYNLATKKRERRDDYFWNNAELIDIDGVAVLQPSLVDSVLLNILDRYMTAAEFMRHSMKDYNDMHVLCSKGGISRETLLYRADNLDILELVKLYLRHCDPRQAKFSWKSLPGYRKYHIVRLHIIQERTMELERLLADGPRALSQALREIVSITHTLYYLSKCKSLNDLFFVNTPQVSMGTKMKSPMVIGGGVKWASLLLRPLIRLQGSGVCLVRSLTLYRRLLQEGYRDIRFVSGVRRDAQGSLQGHAWVEHEGKPLAIFGDMRSPQLYKETWCYPPRDPEAQEAA